MPFYPELKKIKSGQRAARRLLDLRAQIHLTIPPKTIRSTVLIATWNIRDFDSNKFKHGPRLPESFFYIAEIINSFDIVAIQEVNENLKALEKVMKILGPYWDYIVTDSVEGSSGNKERMTFLFDRRKILFRNIAGEIVLPKNKKIFGEMQFARTPFIVSFQAGWFKFNLCTVHIYYGASSGNKLKRRIDEIDSIASFLESRAKKSRENYIMLGDFNIVESNSDTMKPLKVHNFFIPTKLAALPSNMDRTKHYDQIAFMTKKEEVKFCNAKNNAGVFDFYESVFRSDKNDYEQYYERMDPEKRDLHDNGIKKGQLRNDEEKIEYYKDTWRTYQMSDHLPMWVALEIDFTEKYLENIAKKH